MRPVIECEEDKAGQHALCGHPEHCSVTTVIKVTTGAATGSRAVEIAVTAQCQARIRICPVSVGEGDERGQHALSGYPEYSAETTAAATGSRAVEIAVAAQRQTLRTCPVGNVDVAEQVQHSVGGQLKHRPV